MEKDLVSVYEQNQKLAGKYANEVREHTETVERLGDAMKEIQKLEAKIRDLESKKEKDESSEDESSEEEEAEKAEKAKRDRLSEMMGNILGSIFQEILKKRSENKRSENEGEKCDGCGDVHMLDHMDISNTKTKQILRIYSSNSKIELIEDHKVIKEAKICDCLNDPYDRIKNGIRLKHLAMVEGDKEKEEMFVNAIDAIIDQLTRFVEEGKHIPGCSKADVKEKEDIASKVFKEGESISETLLEKFGIET